MKKTTVIASSVLAALALLALSTSSAFAANGNWTNDASSVWSTATNWDSNPTVPGTAAGDVVGLNFDITAARAVTIDTTSRTVGTLNLGDPASSFFGYTLANSGGASLIFDNGGSGATLAQTTVGGANDTISTPIALNDNLTVNNVNGLTLSGAISSGSGKSLTKIGNGTLTLSAQNTFTGGAMVNAGTLKLSYGGGAACLRNNSLTINPGATVSMTSGDTLGYTSGQVCSPVNILGGTLDNALSGNNGYFTTFNLMGGVITNSLPNTTTQGINFNGASGAINTLATNIASYIYAPVVLRANTMTITVAQGTVPGGFDLVIAGPIIQNGGNSFIKAGDGALLLTGTNNYTGTTTINAGLVQIGDGISANSAVLGNINVTSGTLVFANPTASTYSGVLSGSMTLVKTGAGALTLSGANSFGGATTVSNGTLLVTTTPNQYFGQNVTVADGATLGVAASSDAAYFTSGGLTVGSSTGATLQFGVTGTTTAPLQPGSLALNGTTTINISSCPIANNVTYPLFTGFSSGALVLGSQPLAVFGQLVTNGSTISYMVTNVAPDVWTAAVDTNWDSATANWTNSLGGNLFVPNYPVQLDDSANGTSPLLVNIASNAVPSTMLVSNTAKQYIIGGLPIIGATALTKTGNNTLTLTGTNTFTGATTISGGTVEIGGTGQLGGGSYSAGILDNATLLYNSTAAQTLSGVISGTGSVVKTNTGTLTLSSGSSTFNGGVTINSGTVNVTANSTPQTGTVTSGPVGTGTITLAGGTLQNNAGITLANNINVTAASAITSVSQNLNLNGNLTGGGNITYTEPGNASTLALGGNDSGYSGTFTVSGNNAAFQWMTAAAGSSNAAWVLSNTFGSGGRMRFSGGWSGTIDLGSLSGNGIGLVNNNAGTVTMSVGALNTSTTFSGTMIANGANIIALTKVGTGSLTLSGASSHTGVTTIENGSLVAGANAPASANGPFGNASSAIALGDSVSLNSAYNPLLMINGAFTVGRTITVGSAAGANSSTYTIGGLADANSAFSGNISLNQSLSVSNVASTTGNALTISAVISTLNGAIPAVTFGGPGNIKLTVANTYSGNTIISGGKLILSGSGNIGSSASIKVGSGAIYDVSGVTYTLGGSQTLLGTGSVTGAVATASSGSSLSPATNGVVGTLTFNGDLNLSSGASPVFDLSTSSSSGNDQIVIGGSLTLNGSDTIHVNALSGSANLDTADYVLFSVTGTTAMASQPGLVFDNTAPANASHYSVKTSGNNVVLRYSASPAPVVTSVVVTNNADGSTVASRGQSVTVYVMVQPGVGALTNVSADLHLIGGSSSQTLTYVGGITTSNYTYTLQVGPGAIVGADLIGVTATDTTPLSGSGSATLTVNASTEVWDGLAADNNWSSGANWVGGYPPGYAGDTLIFSNNVRTTPNMETNYGVAGLTFDASAGNFIIGSANGSTLTLNGMVENDSYSVPNLNVAMWLPVTETINAAANDMTLGGSISGPGGLITEGVGVVTLAGANSYAGDTTISNWCMLANGAAIPNGSGAGNVIVFGILDLYGTNATVNGLTGGSGASIANNGDSPSILTLGANDQGGAFDGPISDYGAPSLALAKIGTNTLALSGANTFSGGTVLSNGILSIGSSTALGSGTVVLAGGTLTTLGNGNQTINNTVEALTNTSSVLDTAPANGNLTLAGNLTGGGTITRGTPSAPQSVYLAGDDSGFTGTFQDQNSANSVTRFTLPTAGSAAARWIFNQAQIASRTSLDYSNGTIQFGSISGAGYLYGNSTGAKTVEVGALGLNNTFAGSLQDGAGQLTLTKVGSGTLTLSGANTYTGPTIVSNGTLIVSSAKTSTGDFTVVDGATLGVNLASAGASLQMTSLTLGNSTNSFSGLNSSTVAAITNSGALTLAGTVTVNVAGIISVGSYPLIASASIGGTGGLVIGSLPWGAAATLATNGNTIVLNVTTGSVPPFAWTGLNNGNWDLTTANNWTSNGLSAVYSDGQVAQFDNTSMRTNVVVATNVTPAAMIVTNSIRNYTFSGAAITGSGSLTKQGSGVLTLVNTNSYTGGTVINNGTLQLGDGIANNGVVAGGITDNGSLTFANPLDQTFASVISGTGSVIKQGAGALTLGVSNPYSGGTTLAAGSVVIPNGSTNAFGSGTLTLSNASLVVQPGSGSAWNNANSDYIGNSVNVPAGTINIIDNSQNNYGNLWVGGDGVQWTGSGTVKFQNSSSVVAPAVLWNGNILTDFHGTINIGATNSSARMYNGFGYNSSNGGGIGTSVATIDASGVAWQLGDVGYSVSQSVDAGCTTIKLGSISAVNANTAMNGNGSATTPLTYEVGALNTTTTYAGTINDGGQPGTRLTKVGAGTLTLSGANTYTGATTVSNGTLLVSGSIASAVAVNGGALGGTGTVGGAVTVNSGGTLSPGASVGTLTVNNNLTLAGNTLIELDKSLSPQSNDVVNVSGTLIYGGTLTVTNLGPALAAGDSFRVFPSGGSGSMSVTGDAGDGLAFSISDGVVSVVTAVQSPAHITSFGVNGTTLTITATNGTANGQYLLLESTNVALPLSDWTPVLTNNFDGNGDINLSTNIVNPNNVQEFYILSE